MSIQAPSHKRSHPNAGSALNLELVRQEQAGRSECTGTSSANQDYFMERAGVRCAGSHLIIDLYGASNLTDLPLIENTLRKCVDAAGATLLHVHLHRFEPSGGISGVAVLAESHISIHSWPEQHYAALDIFMCGKARPERCIEVLLEAFAPRRVAIEELLRGRMS